MTEASTSLPRMPHQAYFVNEDDPPRIKQSTLAEKGRMEHNFDNYSDRTSQVEDEIVYIHGLRFWSITAV